MAVQAQIRQNAEEVSNYLSDMVKWEKEVLKKDKKMTASKSRKAPAVRGGVGTVEIKSTPMNTETKLVKKMIRVPKNINKNAIDKNEAVNENNNLEQQPSNVKSTTAAKHTYDIGYKKWENFDVEEALKNVEVKSESQSKDNDEDYEYVEMEVEEEVPQINASNTVNTNTNSTINATPATVVDRTAPNNTITAPVARARGKYVGGDVEAAERERGNSEFKNGNFGMAVKSYTRCLGLKARNYVAFSNRAMAHLKLKEYAKAEEDTSCALKIQPMHVKSLLRRATARTSQGKLRAAVRDLLLAKDAETPPSKQIIGELSRTRELLKNAVSRAPMVRLPTSRVNWYGQRDRNGDVDECNNSNNVADGDVLVLLEGPQLSSEVEVIEMDDEGNYDLSATSTTSQVAENSEQEESGYNTDRVLEPEKVESVRIAIEVDNDDDDDDDDDDDGVANGDENVTEFRINNKLNIHGTDTSTSVSAKTQINSKTSTKIKSEPSTDKRDNVEDVASRLRDLELEDTAMIAAKTKGSALAATKKTKASGTIKSKNKSSSKGKLPAIGAYALERLLLGCKGSHSAYQKVFGVQGKGGELKAKQLPALLSKLLEADLAYMLLAALDDYHFGDKDKGIEDIHIQIEGMVIWLETMTKDGAGWKNLQSIARLLQQSQREEIQGVITRLKTRVDAAEGKISSDLAQRAFTQIEIMNSL